ncbi:hypothetical protein V6N11_050042 [Hibiscus sabdariffa]|uniref:HMA domain-containing protein n=1 Tax=Hibiscus sabdariffa TaxID=183260 RepID=A0ABR2T9C7_9ROSI
MKKGKIRGFMCQSTAVNSTCMAADPRSVVMPRKFDRIRSDETRLIHDSRYSSFVEPRRFVGADKRLSIGTPFVRKGQSQEQKPMFLPKPVQQASSDHVFQLTPEAIALQVVVMRVALHCQGCAGKVKKHLSRMEGIAGESAGEHFKGEKGRVLALLKSVPHNMIFAFMVCCIYILMVLRW